MPDSAYATFEIAFERAAYLLRLYSGLTNHRQRGMRADWAENFCRLMHWPVADGQQIDRVDSPDAIIVIKQGSRLDRDVFSAEALMDLLRASLVMGVSAVDAFFHSKIVAYVVSCARQGAAMPGALKKATISVEEFVDGRRYRRRMTIVRKSIERTLGFQSLQQPNKIEEALAMIGVSGFWNGVAARLLWPQSAMKAELTKIVKRRNQIAHEGDLSQTRKYRNRPHDLAPAFVQSALDFLKEVTLRAEHEINYQLGN
jgi:hypothetical protein